MFFDNMDDPRKQALLTMGLGLLSGRGGKGFGGFMRDVGGAGLLGMNAYGQAQAMNDRRSQEAQERELRAMQMAQMKQAQEDQSFARQIAPNFFAPGVQPNTPVDDEGNPMPSYPAKADLAGYGQALAARNPQMGAQFMAMGKKQGPQYKEVGGRLVRIDGDSVKEAYAPPAKSVHQVGQTRELKSGRRILTQEFDGSGWKTISTSDMDKPESKGGPAAPAGYRWNASGGLEPIPGGPADAKAGKEAEKEAAMRQAGIGRAEMVLGQIEEAIQSAGPTTTGTIGAIARNIPATDAYNLNKVVDSIKANIGFAELQAMRQASPTGGALGQVAVQELNSLQSVLGSLDTAQSQQQLERNLYKAQQHYRKWKQVMQQAESGGDAPQPQSGVRRYNPQTGRIE